MKNLVHFAFIILSGISCSSGQEVNHSKMDGKQLSIQESSDDLLITKADKPILRYQKSTVKPSFSAPEYYQRSGFIHPIYTPGGLTITDDFPVGHTHQHAFFHAWTHTTFKGEKVDFWNQQHELGDIKHHEVLDLFTTDSTAGFKVTLQHLSLKYGPVLKENWTITVFDRPDYHLWEIALIQNNISNDTLFINDYHYGGLGFRGSRHWNQEDSIAFQNPMKVITSEGLKRDSANHSRPEWLSAFAAINDSLASLALLDHPNNFRYPQPVRVHPEMPYFCKAPMVGQAFNIPPNSNYQARYRILVFDGMPDKKAISKVQKHFAKF